MSIPARLAIALTLCLGLAVSVPSASFSSVRARGHAAVKKKKCKKGTKLTKGKCKAIKKQSAAVPANSTLNGTNGLNLVLATKAGKRVVHASMLVTVTCGTYGSPALSFSLDNMPLVGTSFHGTTGTTTISGTFLSKTRVHLKVQVVNAEAVPGITCSGSADITSNLHA